MLRRIMLLEYENGLGVSSEVSPCTGSVNSPSESRPLESWLRCELRLACTDRASIRSADTPALGVTELFVALMFLGIFLYVVRWFLSTFPLIQVWQPMVDPETFEVEVATSGVPSG